MFQQQRFNGNVSTATFQQQRFNSNVSTATFQLKNNIIRFEKRRKLFHLAFVLIISTTDYLKQEKSSKPQHYVCLLRTPQAHCKQAVA
jgi:hypothetical protein